MNSDFKLRIARTLQTVVGMLVKESFGELEKLSDGVRLKASDIESAISRYGKTLAEPSLLEYERAEIVQVEGRTPAEYSVWFQLWTREEGKSDLCLRLTMFDSPQLLMKIQIDDIRVN